jgi:branched-chain amino acid transport system substrate-binding protein
LSVGIIHKEIEMRAEINRGLMARIGLALAFGAAALCGPRLALAQDCEARIGVVGPMSGGGAQWGLSARNGAEIAAAEANESGGLQIDAKKCKVVVSSYDTRYSAEGAAAGANALASPGVGVIVGPIGAPEATGIKPVAERNKQVTMNSGFAKDAIGPQWPLAFHAAPGPAAFARPVAKLAKERFPMTRPARMWHRPPLPPTRRSAST